MLVLLDENLPQGLHRLIVGHEARTVAFQGWSGLSNGAMLDAAEAAGFQVLVTADRHIQNQQTLERRKLSIVVLSGNERKVVVKRVHKIIAAIEAAEAGCFHFVDLENDGEQQPGRSR